MYHEQSYEKIGQRRALVRRALVAVALCAVVAGCVSGALMQHAREQGAASLRDAILAAANQCCAVEGAYPLSLAHLEDTYGLSINHNDYVVTYEAYAGNVAPTVVVSVR